MTYPQTSPNTLRLLWVYSGSLAKSLDSATWLKTTAELRRLGWQVTLVAAGASGIQQIHGVEVLCIPQPNIYFLRQAVFHFRVLGYIFTHFTAIDIILFHEVSALWLLPLRLLRFFARRRNPILVMDTRSLPMDSLLHEGWKDRIRRYFYFWVSWLGNHFADGRLAITQRMAAAVQIPKHKLWGHWPSGADPQHFLKAQSERRWSLPSDSIHLIYHGSLHYERNLMALSRAVVLANTKGMSFVLTLIGDGNQKEELQTFAAHTQGCIQVLPLVAYEEIPKFLAFSHVGVLPFPDEEKYQVCSPIKLFEYLAAGLPILATRVVCHSDILGSAEYVFWAETSTEDGLLDALRQVWKSHAQLSKMGQQAFASATLWTWAASAQKLSAALQKGCQTISPL
jgi:glycosyltransferase involved in cell wall biosynthesis